MNDKGTGRGLLRGLTSTGDRGLSVFLRRSFASSMGLSRDMLDRPIVGVAHAASGFNSCHRHFSELIEAVKRGVLAAGALPIEFPTISLGELFLSPNSLKFRNLMSIDVEEMIRAQPIDAVVLLGGCDKTVPAQLMGAASADLPAIQLVAGPMSTGRYRGERLCPCTDCRRFWAKYRAGEIDKRRDRRHRAAPRPDRRHRRRDGDGEHHGMPSPKRSAWRRRARRRFPPSTRIGCEWRKRRPHSGQTLGADHLRPSRIMTRRRSTTRCGCCWRSAARPTRSST